MTSIKKISFPFKTHEDYPFHKVDFAYNFSKVIKVVNLQTYLFLAVDQQFNLHFIQYRDPYPHEKPIVPPSFALKGKGHIKFSLEYHTLKAFFNKINPEEVEFSSYFCDRLLWQDEWPENWPDVFYVGQDRLLIKPSTTNSAIFMYYDHRLEFEQDRTMITNDCLKTDTTIVPVDAYRVILYGREHNMAALTCALSQKVKTLNFTQKHGIDDLKVLAKHGLAIAISSIEDHSSIEILDIIKNKVIQKTTLFDVPAPQVVVDEVDHSGKFIIYYIQSMKVILTVWRTLPDRTIQSSKRIELLYPADPDVIGFLNQDYVVVLSESNEVGIYRLDDKGLIKVSQTVISLDPGYLPEVNPSNLESAYKYSCITVLDEKTFVAVKGKISETSTAHQQVVVFNYAFESQGKAEGSEFARPKHFKKMTAEVLIDHIPDKVIGITHWEDKFVVFLTQSGQLYHYDLQTGKLRVILTLEAINSPFVSMQAISDKFVALIFNLGLKRILAINLNKNRCSYDSHSEYFGKAKIWECFFGMGRIFITYNINDNNIESAYFGEINHKKKHIKMISNCPYRHMFNLALTRRSIVIGTISVRTDGDRELGHSIQKVIFYSLAEKKILYAIKLDDICQKQGTRPNMSKIVCINDHLILFCVRETSGEDGNFYIILWDMDKRCVIAKYQNSIKQILGVCKGHLLFKHWGDGLTGVLDLSPFLRKIQKEKKEPDELEQDILVWSEFSAVLKCTDTLTPKLPVFVGYEKRMYPNSLLFFRKRTLKTECLRIVNRQIGKVYNPYITRQIMDMIFKPKGNDNSSEESKEGSEVGEA